MALMPDEAPIVLPEPVRHRVVTLAARALDDIDQRQLPASLRKVARFTPARRARLAASLIATAVATDDAFRERVATLAAPELEPVATAIAENSVASVEPVEVAAAAYLTRGDGWRDALAAALEGLEADRSAAVASAAEEIDTAERLRSQLEDVRQQLRSLRMAHRAELDDLKADNTDLRRKLGDARARARTAQAERERVETDAEAERAQERARASEQEAELRRLRQRLDAALADAGDKRRQVRDDRAKESMRARLLLDAVIDGAQGLRRELALPPLEALPADVVDDPSESTVAEQRSHPVVGDATRLRALLELPRVHLIVDGYNVSKTVWPELPLDRQRTLLVAELGALAARTSAEVTVVFDGADVSSGAAKPVARGVRVRFSPADTTADDIIAELVAAEPAGRSLVVVSSDAEVAAHARRAGARPAASAALAGVFDRGGRTS